MVISKSEILGLLLFSIRHTAEKLGIGEVDWKAPKELLEDIQSRDQEIYNLLENFIKAYYTCYKKWTPKNIAKRNEARNAILARLNQM